jgi:hypothetical protein
MISEAEDVRRADAEARVDLCAHVLGPRLGAESREAQADLVRGDAAFLEGLREQQRVTRRAGDQVRAKVLDQRQLPLGHPARDRDDVQAERLASSVQPEASGEEAVAVRVVEGHPRLGACHCQRACVDTGKEIEVITRVADDRGLAGRPGGRVDPGEVAPWDCEHPRRVGVAEIVLAREGQRAEVVEGADAPCVDVREALLVQRDTLLHSFDERPEPHELDLRALVARHRLERGLEDHGPKYPAPDAIVRA